MTIEPPTVRSRLPGALRPFNRPHHYALAIVVGMVIGVVPKFSIIPWLVMLIGMLLPTNLVAMVLAAIVFSFVGPLLDPQSHRLGANLLANEELAEFWTSLFSIKHSIWLQLHNSVVLGSGLIALAAMIPLYIISRTLTAILKPIVTKYILSNGVADWIRGYPLQTG